MKTCTKLPWWKLLQNANERNQDDLLKYIQLSFDNGAKAIQWRRDSFAKKKKSNQTAIGGAKITMI